MEKSAYNPSYPQMPATMAAVDDEMKHLSAPPSYDQATSTSAAAAAATNYPPVQVLPTSTQVGWTSGAQETSQQRQPNHPQPTQQPSYATHHHNPPPVINIAPTPTQYSTYHQGVPQPTMQQPMVIIQQQALIPLGPESTYVTCPSCHVQKMTRIEYEPSSRTHLMAALLCILGFWCCVCLPYCAGSCMNANHYCGNCNKFLGTYGGGL